jgi:hypothetical protein
MASFSAPQVTEASMRGRKARILIAALLVSAFLTTALPAFAASEKVLYSFCSAQNCIDGANPYFGLTPPSSN